jgi:hypothetical protein
MSPTSRRTFLQASTLTAFAATRAWGANDRINIAVVGIVHKRRAVQMLNDGVIGQLYMARGLCYKRRKSVDYTPVEAVPPGVDWDKFRAPYVIPQFVA